MQTIFPLNSVAMIMGHPLVDVCTRYNITLYMPIYAQHAMSGIQLGLMTLSYLAGY